ncbi:hypothetical protein BUALT_Bualt02G0207900 [Buddleja alternifolia]|uniref:C2H2-type domain-containing protein n=1 Tax=Buddleja alternifolia TaxID=168488 RepID=A0AAV6Y8Q5_9LAMI|nr:hypothetical protein BUALT_Bualt02G0207900 [Buddleja alternifolia]
MEPNYDQDELAEHYCADELPKGVGRWYECVFCKRGFNTAQALGGHMNIHRKDRTTSSKPAASTSSNNPIKQTRNINHAAGSRLYPQVQPSRVLDHDLPVHQYFSDDRRRSDYDHRQALNLLSLEFDHPTVLEDLEKNRSQVMDQKEDLDLELRLGCN